MVSHIIVEADIPLWSKFNSSALVFLIGGFSRAYGPLPSDWPFDLYQSSHSQLLSCVFPSVQLAQRRVFTW